MASKIKLTLSSLSGYSKGRCTRHDKAAETSGRPHTDLALACLRSLTTVGSWTHPVEGKEKPEEVTHGEDDDDGDEYEGEAVLVALGARHLP